SGSLPTGLTLNSSTGAITGTPTGIVTATFTISATDSLGSSASRGFTVIINQAVSITTTTLADWTLNLAGYNQTVAATGATGAKPFAVPSGALPTGLTLNSASGAITGTPTSANAFTFTITATDTVGASGNAAFTVTINPAVSITTTTLADWTINIA